MVCKSVFCATVICVMAAVSAQADGVRVFLLGGQSNMQGLGSNTGLPPELQGPQNDVLMYFGSSLTVLQPGFGANSSLFGPEITFGRTIADALPLPSENFALIKYAQSGTNLEDDWDPSTGATYAVFRNTVSSGLTALANAGHATEIVGMLWTQGERDARIGTGPQYEENLHAFIADLRSRYGTDLPFFLSQLSSQQTDLPAIGLSEVRQAQANVATGDPHSYLIITDTFSMGSDQLHFDAAGQIALGATFADVYINTVVPSIPTASQWGTAVMFVLLLIAGAVLLSRGHHARRVGESNYGSRTQLSRGIRQTALNSVT